MDKCFVIQPFDGAAFDKRFDDVLAPAIKDAGLDAYRVDRDPGAVIPIDNITEGIELSRICIADISLDNPNVWFELGYAIAANKHVVLICSAERSKFPFDVQHRTIIRYETTSTSDFERLGKNIKEKLLALMKQEQRVSVISSTTEVAGLEGFEIAALVSIVEELHEIDGGVNSFHIQNAMENAGYTKVAASLGVRGLMKKGFVTEVQVHDYNGNEYTAYRETALALDWLAENTDKLRLTKVVAKPTTTVSDFDEEIPF